MARLGHYLLIAGVVTVLLAGAFLVHLGISNLREDFDRRYRDLNLKLKEQHHRLELQKTFGESTNTQLLQLLHTVSVLSNVTSSLRNQIERKIAIQTSQTFLLGVFSVAGARAKRQAIRDSWMRNPSVSGNSNAPVRVAFVIGNSALDDNVRREIEVYGDIVVLDVAENMNQGKTRVWFNTAGRLPFAEKYQFIAKMDDDTSPNIEAMLEIANARFPNGLEEMVYFGTHSDCGGYGHCPVSNDYMSGALYGVSRVAMNTLLASDQWLRPMSGFEDLEMGRIFHDILDPSNKLRVISARRTPCQIDYNALLQCKPDNPIDSWICLTFPGERRIAWVHGSKSPESSPCVDKLLHAPFVPQPVPNLSHEQCLQHVRELGHPTPRRLNVAGFFQPPCVHLPVPVPATADDVVFVVITSAETVEKRIPLLRETWLQDTKHVVLASDVTDTNWGTLSWPKVVNVTRGDIGLRTLWGLRHVTEATGLSEKPWVFICDDDSFVSVERLLEFLSQFNADSPLVLGQTHFDQGTFYPAGSAGVVFSRGAAQQLAPMLTHESNPGAAECPFRGPGDVAIGIQIGQCAWNHGFPILHHSRFHSDQMTTDPDAITLHNVNDRMQQLYAERKASFKPVQIL